MCFSLGAPPLTKATGDSQLRRGNGMRGLHSLRVATMVNSNHAVAKSLQFLVFSPLPSAAALPFQLGSLTNKRINDQAEPVSCVQLRDPHMRGTHTSLVSNIYMHIRVSACT